MALEIEDGSGKADANSYVTVAEARQYAQARGVSLPATEEAVEALLIQGMDYLEAQRSRFQGSKTHPGVQALQWPRSGVILDCSYRLPDNVIPVELKKAQMQAALEQAAGLVLMPSSDGRVVKREKVDVVEVEYAGAFTAADARPVVGAVEHWLAPLLVGMGWQ